jgi:uncharacterized protein YkwD
MRRSTYAALALACMGTSVGAAAVMVPPVSAGASPTQVLGTAVAEHGTRVDPAVATDRPAKRSAARRYSRQAHQATNNRRADQGLEALRRTDCVQRYAVRQAKRMAAQERMYHQQLEPILAECGLAVVGENVAYGYPNGRVVVNDGWMKSPGHRANILNPVYRLMGVGARKGGDGLWYVAQVFGTGL